MISLIFKLVFIMNFITSMLSCKCPRCRQGDLFVKPFNIKKPVDMPDNCLVCGQAFMPEPGFYYGAMFVSYIFSGFFFLGLAGLGIMYLHLSLNVTFLFILIIAALTYFPILRISRSVWIHLMVKYDPEASKQRKTRIF